jgi:hypothetical protein
MPQDDNPAYQVCFQQAHQPNAQDTYAKGQLPAADHTAAERLQIQTSASSKRGQAHTYACYGRK